MNFKAVVAAAILAATGAVAAVAADEPQVVRQEMMKKMGGAIGALAGIAKGEKPYDADVVKSALMTMDEVSKTFPDYFPAGSETGFDTEASPKIWENMADFKAHAAALSKEAETVLAALPADQAGVTAAIGPLGKSCGSCHEVYRLKKN